MKTPGWCETGDQTGFEAAGPLIDAVSTKEISTQVTRPVIISPPYPPLLKNQLTTLSLTASFSRQGMRGFNHRLQPLVRDMRVNLRRRDIRVAQHRLDTAQIGAAFDEVGGEGVAQDVWRKFVGVDAGVNRQL